MKVLLPHGAKLKEFDSKLYAVPYISGEYLDFYTRIFGQLLITARSIETANASEVQDMMLMSRENIEIVNIDFKEVYSAIFFPRRKIVSKIQDCVNRCDLASVQLPTPMGILTIRALHKIKKPYMLHVGGCAWESLLHHSFRGKLLAPLMWLLVRKAVKKAPYVYYVAEFLQKRYPSNGKCECFSNVALKSIDAEVLSHRLERIQNKEKSPLIIGTTGAVDVKYKGQQYVMKALAKLKSKGMVGFKYQIVGGGDQSYLRSVAERYNVASQVEFLGVLPHEKVFNWLDSIDIYIQPSRTEGLPRALIEAMSRGVPACGTKTGGIPELLTDEFLFNNSRNKVDEIAILFLKMQSSQVREEQARRNFNEAKKYAQDVLNVKRMAFFEKFKGEMLQ